VQQQSTDPIPIAECWKLLRTESVGRLALSLHALPAILPVQYYFDGDRLAICLGHHKVPHQAVDDTVVAFAADAIDAISRTGWTVQVQGTARLPAPVGVPTDCGQSPAGQVVYLSAVTIAGHRIRLCPLITASNT
jgi:Pyridoxamine 5'-phosphate oxidase